MKRMPEIRFLDYTMRLDRFFKLMFLIVVCIIGTQKFGAVFFTGLLFTGLGGIGVLLSALFWFTDEGPMLSNPVKNTLISVGVLLFGITLLFL